MDASEYQSNWAVTGLCEHLEAVAIARGHHPAASASITKSPSKPADVARGSMLYLGSVMVPAPARLSARQSTDMCRLSQLHYARLGYLQHRNSTRRVSGASHVFSPWHRLYCCACLPCWSDLSCCSSRGRTASDRGMNLSNLMNGIWRIWVTRSDTFNEIQNPSGKHRAPKE
jgi:hypothetical protein